MHTAAPCVEQQSAMQARHVCIYPYSKYTYMHVNMRIMLCACNILPTPILVLEMLHQLQYHQAYYLTNTCLTLVVSWNAGVQSYNWSWCHMGFSWSNETNSCTHTHSETITSTKLYTVITLFVRILHSGCSQVILLLVADVMPTNRPHLTIRTRQVPDGTTHECKANVLKIHNVFH